MLRYALVVGAPLMILVGGTVGALAAALLAANPTYQVGERGGRREVDRQKADKQLTQLLLPSAPRRRWACCLSARRPYCT